MKAVIGRQGQQEKAGVLCMTLDELLLNVKAVSFDSVVHQTDVLTEDDKQDYQSKGYFIQLTLDEFKEQFANINPEHIHYTNSVSMNCFYMNYETLAVCPFHLEMLLGGIAPSAYTPDSLTRAFEEREKEVANGEYWGSIITLPDAMRIEYFKMLIDKKGAKNIPKLYQFFIANYTQSDYGFGNMDAATLYAILQSKSPNEKRETTKKLKELPDVLTIYRGGNSASTPYEQGYSWTLDVNTANFFAIRRGSGPAYIVTGKIKKEDVIEYIDDRGEEEIIVLPNKVEIVDVLNLKDYDFLKEMLPKVVPMYHKYRDMLIDLDFNMKSSIHGKEHCARVLLMCLILSEMLGLPSSDRKILATAAIYHDSYRTHDGVEPAHGKAGKDYYRSDVNNPDPLVEFLCEYHCLPDDLGFETIKRNRKLSKNRERANLLFKVFKDADGLERVRLGDIRREMDMKQYRLPETKELTLVARINLEQIKL